MIRRVSSDVLIIIFVIFQTMFGDGDRDDIGYRLLIIILRFQDVSDDSDVL